MNDPVGRDAGVGDGPCTSGGPGTAVHAAAGTLGVPHWLMAERPWIDTVTAHAWADALSADLRAGVPAENRISEEPIRS